MANCDDKFYSLGNTFTYQWNRKVCFEARDTLFECVDQQDNGNKFRCPDQLYAYEMWCPPEFRRVHSSVRRQHQRDALNYTQEYVDKVNREHQVIDTRKFTRQ